jgi:hypothetical protein
MLKKEIKNKNNSDKITFSTFKTLNTQFSRKNFRNNLLNKCIQHFFPFNNMKLDSFLEKKSMKHHFFLAQSATDLTRKETYNISEFYK